MMRKLQAEMTALFKQLYADEPRILVFGEGDPGASLVLIGEAPGEQETVQGRPFVGKAGKNLDELLELSGLERQSLYITNTVKFRPVKRSAAGRLVNRPPTQEEVGLCLPFLLRELDLLTPRVIATLGNTPLRALLGRQATIGEMHGRQIPFRDGILYPLYHPASLIYNPSLRETYQQDVVRLGELMRSL